MNAPFVMPTQTAVADLTDILVRQRAAFLREGPPSLAARKSDLLKLKRAVQQNLRAFERSLNADYQGRSSKETSMYEGAAIVQAINYMHRHLKRWMRPQRRHVDMHFLPGSARVLYQPLGVVGIMSPWNLPVTLSLMPLATAIAAGNRAMLKPSEATPATSELLVKILGDIFPAEQVSVVTGGAEIGAAFSSLPFDHLIFTGSTPIGKAVMKSASANLVPVTLELGGKSPAIVDTSYSIERAAKSIAFGKVLNGGQVCISPDYALVPKGEVDAFVSAFDKAVHSLFPSGPMSEDYTSILNERHYHRLQSLLEEARSKGAKVIEVGEKPETAANRPHTMAPTIVLGATREMGLLSEEIFGPILPVVPYDGIENAISYVNSAPRPLALYYFGRDDANRKQVLARTTSGNVTINDTMMHFAQDDLPFGGVGPSGMGAYHGIEGFRSLSHAKGVFEQGNLNFGWALHPPYGRIFSFITQYLLR